MKPYKLIVEGDGHVDQIEQWIQHFFNITKEDLD